MGDYDPGRSAIRIGGANMLGKDTPSGKHGNGKMVHFTGKTFKFKNKRLQDMFVAFRDDPDRLDMRNEIAIARMVLALTIEECKDKEQLSPGDKATLLAITKEVGEVTEQMARVNKIQQNNVTVEHIKLVVDTLCTILAKHVEWRTVEKVILEIENIDLPVGRLKIADEA